MQKVIQQRIKIADDDDKAYRTSIITIFCKVRLSFGLRKTTGIILYKRTFNVHIYSIRSFDYFLRPLTSFVYVLTFSTVTLVRVLYACTDVNLENK